MQRFVLMMTLICVLWLYGCGTSSKVDQFLEQAEQSKITIQTIDTGTIDTIDNDSDDLLWDSTTPAQDSTERWIYKDYTIELLQQAKTKSKRVVIVVYDVSDDNSVKLDKAINLSLWRIPSDVVIVKLPYSQAQELYKVKEKNTVIYLDAKGMITNTSDWGIYTMDSLLYYL